jgi:hypothetical protein
LTLIQVTMIEIMKLNNKQKRRKRKATKYKNVLKNNRNNREKIQLKKLIKNNKFHQLVKNNFQGITNSRKNKDLVKMIIIH